MIDVILILLILAVVAGAIFYIVKEKKKGTVCIGCPMAGQCAKQKNGQGCSNHQEQ